jgi:hypothetical protein
MDKPMQTNVEKLAEFMQSRGIKQSRYSWGPDAAEMNDEQRAEYLLELHTRIETDAMNVVSIPLSQMVHIADALDALVALGQIDLREWSSMPKEVRELKTKIFELAEFPSIFAKQNLPDSLQTQRRAKQKAAPEEES